MSSRHENRQRSSCAWSQFTMNTTSTSVRDLLKTPRISTSDFRDRRNRGFRWQTISFESTAPRSNPAMLSRTPPPVLLTPTRDWIVWGETHDSRSISRLSNPFRWPAKTYHGERRRKKNKNCNRDIPAGPHRLPTVVVVVVVAHHSRRVFALRTK